MSSENEDGKFLDKGSENLQAVSKKPKLSYSRELLLSLCNSDICKKLPSGFDESLVSELEDALLSVTVRPKISGSLPLQGFRRNVYGSPPTSQGDSGNYTHGTYGKWESRASGRSDRDSNDSQSDRDSDLGRRYGHQSRRSGMTPEHDGLLGSGSFPRPSGYAARVSAPKVQTNENYQLSKSNEPYHPPRPYKAMPYSRRDTDSFNNETFGSIDSTNEDRVEEERRRRASFEMIRKEQKKSLEEMQKSNMEKRKAGSSSDICEVLEDGKVEKGLPIGKNELDISAATPILSADLEKSSFASHSHASRPLVPPGFKNSTLEKSCGLKSLMHPPSEVVKPVKRENLEDAVGSLVQNVNNDLERPLSQEISLVNGNPAQNTQPAAFLREGESSNASLDVPTKKLGIGDQILHVSGPFHSHETLDGPEIVDLNAEIWQDETAGDSNRSQSTSILEKIFGSTLSMNGPRPSSAEHHDSKPDDTWSPGSAQSSKFAHWFSDEEAKATDDISSAGPNNLLSLIIGGDKGKHQVSDAEATEHFRHDIFSDGVSDQVYIKNGDEAISTIITCEDLEQTILSEYSANSTYMHPLDQNWSATGAKADQPSEHVEDHASLHLLSMLQKGTDQSNMTVNSGVDNYMAEKLLVSQQHDITSVVKETKEEDNTKSLPNLGKTITLETLFGTAFMKELQSVEAPVSVQRVSIGTARIDDQESYGSPFLVTDIDISSPRSDKNGLQRQSHGHSVSLNNGRQTDLSKAENWLGCDDFEITSLKKHTEAVTNHSRIESAVEFQLPEEDNLLTVGEYRDHQIAFRPTGNSIDYVNFSSNAPSEISDKLAAFGVAVKGKLGIVGSESVLNRASLEQEPEIPNHNLQVQQSFPQFRPPIISQLRPLYHPLEPHPAHMSSQMNILGPDPIFHHDSPADHRFSSNFIRPPFHHLNAVVAGFDATPHHSMLHQMQMPENPHILPEFPRGGPLPHHGNQAAGVMQDLNQMQGFPFGPRGVPMPALDINSGGNPPEAFQRLIEMELRAKSRQIHPFPPSHSQGVYGHEVEMGFQYR